MGYTAANGGEITGSPRSTLLAWCQTYQRGGIAALDDHRQGGNRRKLSAAQMHAIGRTLRLYPPKSRFGPASATPDGMAWTVSDRKRLVTDDYGVTDASVVSYYPRFDRVGYSYHQSSAAYRSRNERAVVDWEAQLEKN